MFRPTDPTFFSHVTGNTRFFFLAISRSDGLLPGSQTCELGLFQIQTHFLILFNTLDRYDFCFVDKMGIASMLYM